MKDLPYAFRDPRLLELALTHASVDGDRNNERLEFLGDAVLDLAIAEALFHRAPQLPEGRMTELKAGVVSRKALASVARELDLAARATLGPGLRDRSPPTSVLANIYEAVVGAIYLDGGFAAARAFVDATLGARLSDTRAQTTAASPKQTLQELSQARWTEVPTYELAEERGRAHARVFLVRAHVAGRAFPSAWGRTRKEAEAYAAQEALLVLEHEPEASDASAAG